MAQPILPTRSAASESARNCLRCVWWTDGSVSAPLVFCDHHPENRPRRYQRLLFLIHTMVGTREQKAEYWFVSFIEFSHPAVVAGCGDATADEPTFLSVAARQLYLAALTAPQMSRRPGTTSLCPSLAAA